MTLNSQDVYFVLMLVLGGAVSGYASGLFGIGGGLILVPLFLTLFPLVGAAHDQVMHCAVGTSLALIIPNCWASMRKHHHLGNVDVRLLKTWLPFIILGSTLGLEIINRVPTTTLKTIFTLYLYGIFLFVLLKKDAPEGEEGCPGFIAQALGGVTFGGLSVLLGVGSGAFTTPFLKAFHYPLRRSLGVSSATGFSIAVVGTLGIVLSGWGVAGRPHYSFGFVSLPAFFIVTPIALWLAPRGVELAHRIGNHTLHWLYATLLLVMALYMTGHIFYAY